MGHERKNVVLKIEYDGLEFFGWQRQVQEPTVQASIEDVLEKLMQKKTCVYGAGRTDRGVSARGQVANFWGDDRLQEKQWALALNSMLPRGVRIIESRFLEDSFHAQKCALGKRYEYRVLNRNCPSALDRHAYFYPHYIDWERVQDTLPYFVGTHDFAAFQGAKASVLTTVRTVTRFDLIEETNGFVRFEVEGTGFLKQMVRAMVGTAIEVGEGKRQPYDVIQILESQDRREAGRTVPAHGLCLAYVDYPEHYGLWRPQQLKGKIRREKQPVFVPNPNLTGPDGYTVN